MPRHPPASLSSIQPLGARITGIEHEWLPSMLGRVGYHFGVSATAISRHCGLGYLDAAPRRRLGFKLSPEAAQRLSAGLGMSTAILETMTMSRLGSVAATRDDGTPSQSLNWTRGSGTRFCPECLADHPGVFYTYWRTWWSFACLRHLIPLASACPACNAEPADATINDARTLDPTRCSNGARRGEPCGYLLSDTWHDDPFEPNSAIIRAQRAISNAWRRAEDLEPLIPIETFRGVAIALLASRDHDRIARLGGVLSHDLLGLIEDTERIGTTPPRDALAMGSLMGAAYRLITDPEQTVSTELRDITFSRPVKSTNALEGPGSAANLLATWPGVDAQMRGRVLRSLDRDLSTMQRLIWGTAASAQSAEGALLVANHLERAAAEAAKIGDFSGMLRAALRRRQRTAHTRDAGPHPLDSLIPDLLWSSWACPLGLDGSTDAVALQRALADALRIAGNGISGGTERIAGIGRRLRPSMLGASAQTTTILRQLSELALLLNLDPPPINYTKRKTLPTDQFLTMEDWNVVANAAGIDPGGERRARNARRYAYLRMTGSGARDLPATKEFRTGHRDAAEYSHFLTTMTAETQTAIDQYLCGWLHRFEPRPDPLVLAEPLHVPIVWAPARFVHRGAALGPELDDIDMGRLHEMVGNGETSISRLSETVARSQRHVRWALSENPVPTGGLVATFDWTGRLANLPGVVSTYSADLERERQEVEAAEARETLHWVAELLS